ncbi:response regulator transcription factor [Flavobacteriaceae bacterium S356]|uniref:Response regulator transcription factor n=1 Tax=Asprobacillus argus TaxID=3076534 RepID=A0ABU3LFA8_9FLAO|nr:response regulator transcription factor [Flavobacteriaceae bacterium S356]
MMIKIFIADDHPIIVKGIKNVLEENNIQVIGTAFDGQAAFNFIIKEKPEIAILDVEMPYLTGIEIAKMCKKHNSKTKIILITLHKQMHFYTESKKYNVYGYLLKEFALQEIRDCVISVKNNIPYFNDKLKSYLNFTDENENILRNLSKKELRVLKLVSQHKTNKEIAELLFISVRTVEKHRGSIILKLELSHVTNSLLIWVQKNKHLINY